MKVFGSSVNDKSNNEAPQPSAPPMPISSINSTSFSPATFNHPPPQYYQVDNYPADEKPHGSTVFSPDLPSEPPSYDISQAEYNKRNRAFKKITTLIDDFKDLLKKRLNNYRASDLLGENDGFEHLGNHMDFHLCLCKLQDYLSEADVKYELDVVTGEILILNKKKGVKLSDMKFVGCECGLYNKKDKKQEVFETPFELMKRVKKMKEHEYISYVKNSYSNDITRDVHRRVVKVSGPLRLRLTNNSFVDLSPKNRETLTTVVNLISLISNQVSSAYFDVFYGNSVPPGCINTDNAPLHQVRSSLRRDTVNKAFSNIMSITNTLRLLLRESPSSDWGFQIINERVGCNFQNNLEFFFKNVMDNFYMLLTHLKKADVEYELQEYNRNEVVFNCVTEIETKDMELFSTEYSFYDGKERKYGRMISPSMYAKSMDYPEKIFYAKESYTKKGVPGIRREILTAKGMLKLRVSEKSLLLVPEKYHEAMTNINRLFFLKFRS